MPWRVGQVYGHLTRTALLHASAPRIVTHKPFLVDHPLGAAVDAMFSLLSKTGNPFEAQESCRWTELREHLCDRARTVDLAVQLADTYRAHRALRVLTLSHVLGCKLKQNAYECVAHQLASARRWPLVTSLVELARRQTGRTTARLLNWRARALIESQEFATLDRVLDIFEQERVGPNRRTFHILVSGHLRNRDLARASDAGIKVDASTHALIISSYRQFGLAHSVKTKALDVLHESDDRSATNMINSLVQQSLDRDDIQGAMRYLALFEPDSMPSTADGGSIHRDGDMTSLGSANRHGPRTVTPAQDAHTFTILINHLAKQADLPRALQILDRMQETGVQPDSSTAAALVRAHFAAGQATAAIRIVANMCHARRVMNASRRIMHASFRQLGLTTSGINEPSLLPPGIPPTVEVFNALIRGTLTTRRLNGMRVVLRIMNFCNIRPDDTTAHLLLLHLDKVEHASPRDIMRRLRRLLPHRATPTIQHLNVILHSILRREDGLRRQMNRTSSPESSMSSEDSKTWDKISGSEESYDPAAGLKVPERPSYRGQFQPILRSLRDRGIRSDRATYALRIRHDATFQAMINRGLHPNVYHFAAVMEGYSVVGDIDGAMSVMDSAIKEGIRPNLKLYTILITACVQQKDAGRALRIFRSMLAANIQPDAIALHALGRAFVAAGQKGEARRILLQLWPMVAVLPEDLHSAPLVRLMDALTSLGGKASKEEARKPLNGREARFLRWKVNRLMGSWGDRPPSLKLRVGVLLRVV
ncbi:uncharacterized protein B0H18DRAFT_1081418 [Fomitopsis serialis]|uniref:uncharacterized protein n=1 Tax=Fomitopsis serialis TaxID=139415 RepID=UPI0020074B57|nr:uncharacterized protein B0H18DRAFT_1081418 [Neoantrodia serialis]KAH9937150.1 hypothetical protein B0H18DRAFT_1081418 [Neoantrodia serialis]